MKGGLLLVAIGAVLLVALAIQMRQTDAALYVTPERVFTLTEQIRVSEAVPGGRMVRSNTMYRRCEDRSNGQPSVQGVWVYYELDGRRFTWFESCWR